MINWSGFPTFLSQQIYSCKKVYSLGYFTVTAHVRPNVRLSYKMLAFANMCSYLIFSGISYFQKIFSGIHIRTLLISEDKIPYHIHHIVRPCCIIECNTFGSQNSRQLHMLCVCDSAVIQRNKEHSFCKFIELL